MNNYVQRLGFTVWRKKTTILVTFFLIILILIGLRYSRIEDTVNEQLLKEERDAQVVADALMNSIKNVKFMEDGNRINRAQTLIGNSVTKLQQMNRDDSLRRKELSAAVQQFEKLEIEQLLGIPYVNLDPKNPYVPKKRLVHLDFKGAPPKLSYLKRFFPMIKVMGATGVLLEYEDMFPFHGNLKNISANNAFTHDDIKDMLKLAEMSKLEVIPLIQTFGHVEFALKHADFEHLREVKGSPQALCPSRSGSIRFIEEIVDQVMFLHPSAEYLHIGCDEVFQIGECDICRLEIHETLFLKHIKTVAELIHKKYPKVRVIIWDDMLRHLPQQSMLDFKLGQLVEPMVWVYAEDIYRFTQPSIWEKYAAVFPTAWTASAFKGAYGETLYIPNAKRHLENNLRWLDVMSSQSSWFKNSLQGIVLTGWQRYDHFAVLCELLPAAIPSLALSLIAVSHGYFNSSLKSEFLSSLNCPEEHHHTQTAFLSLDSDPFLWEKLSKCMFPGNPIFRLMNRLHNTEIEVREYLDVTQRQKGWMTAYNVRHNYSLPLRVDELTSDLARIYHGTLSLARFSVDIMKEAFDNHTIAEWIEQRIYPFILQLEQLQNQSLALKSIERWPVRPLAPLKDLQRLGIAVN